MGREQEVGCCRGTVPGQVLFEVTIVCTLVLLAARKHTGKIRRASSNPRSSKPSKSALSPPKKPKLDNARNRSASGDKVKAESGATEPEAKRETVNEVGGGSSEPMEVEEDEVTGTSKERGGEQEEKEEKEKERERGREEEKEEKEEKEKEKEKEEKEKEEKEEKEKKEKEEQEKEKVEDSDSLAAEKEGTTEPEKKKKNVHPFFGNVKLCCYSEGKTN